MGVSIEQINGLQAIIDDLYNKLEKLNNNSSSNQTDNPNQEQNNNTENNNQQQEETFVPNTNKYKMSDLYPSTYSTMTSVDLNNHPDILNNLTSTKNMFSGCKNLTSILNIDKLNTSHVTNMDGMFHSCSSLTDSVLKNIFTKLDISSVTTMSSCFQACTSITSIDLSALNNKTNLNSISWMFCGCTKLKTVSGSLATNNINYFHDMFQGCTSLTSIPTINTSKATSLMSMFESCSSLSSTFPFTIDCSSVTQNGKVVSGNMTSNYGLQSIFKNSSVTKVTLKNVKSDIKSQFTTASLKENGNLTITFI